MYAGRDRRARAGCRTCSLDPRHPYTLGLLRSAPDFDARRDSLVPIPGSPPNLADPPDGLPVPSALRVRARTTATVQPSRCASCSPAAARRPACTTSASLEALAADDRRMAARRRRAADRAAAAASRHRGLLRGRLGSSPARPASRSGAARRRRRRPRARAAARRSRLVGESGSGKSTLARALAGLHPADRGRDPASTAGCCPASAQRADQRRIQMVFQDPYSSLNPRMTVGSHAAASCSGCTTWCPPARSSEYCTGLLNLVGLGRGRAARVPQAVLRRPAPAGRDRPGAGAAARRARGRRAGVRARRLASRRPSSNLLRDLRGELGLTLLLISHNLAVVRHLCDRVAVMYLGRIVETGAGRELFGNPRHPYTRGLLAAIPRLSDRAQGGPRPARRSSATRRARCGSRRAAGSAPGARSRRSAASTEDPVLRTGPGEPGHEVACHFAFTGAFTGTPGDSLARADMPAEVPAEVPVNRDGRA